jgi:hypothetical protein
MLPKRSFNSLSVLDKHRMAMTSDRFLNPVFREFYSEKDVLMEERRLSENRPGYLFDEQVTGAFYTASPYHWDVIGWMDDLVSRTGEVGTYVFSLILEEFGDSMKKARTVDVRVAPDVKTVDETPQRKRRRV